MSEKLRVAILMSVFNKKEQALNCLSTCYEQIETITAKNDYIFEFFVNANNSSDGLVDDLKAQFPNVQIVRTYKKEHLSKALVTAWQEATKQDFDFYLLMDYSLELKDNALDSILETSRFLKNRSIVTASILGYYKDLKEATNKTLELKHGGRNKQLRLISPNEIIPLSCFSFDSNLLLIPKYVYEKIGTLDPKYDLMATYHYAKRAKNANITRVVAPKILAVSNRTDSLAIWLDPKYSLRLRYKAVLSNKARVIREKFGEDRRSKGILSALYGFIDLNINILFPD